MNENENYVENLEAEQKICFFAFNFIFMQGTETSGENVGGSRIMNEEITLYPSNWLYNAGVVGFLRVLEECGENIENFLKDDGSVKIELKVIERIFLDKSSKAYPLSQLSIWHWYFIEETYKWAYQSIDAYIYSQLKKIKLEKIKKGGQRKQILKYIIDKNLNFDGVSFDDEVNLVEEKVKELDKNVSEKKLQKISKEISKIIKHKEDFYIYRKTIGFLFSSGGFYQNLFNPSQFKNINKFIEKFNYNQIFKAQNSSQLSCTFCSDNKYETSPIDLQFMSYLFPAASFINTYWNLNKNSITQICSLCKFLIIHLHLTLVKLSDNSQIFINAPSFKLMWRLNNYAQKLYGHAHSVKEILGISLIELARKMYIQLGKWEKMNIEVVIKYNDTIDFFSLPYEIVDLISNREIASLLNQIGEFKVLNYVLDGKFNMILEFGEKIMRIASKPESERRKDEEDFINENIKLPKNKDNLMAFSQKLFKLYALINDNTKRRY